MKVQLNRKESSYSKLPELHIAASEIVSDETFEQMQAHPLWDHDVIQKHIQDMRSVAGTVSGCGNAGNILPAAASGTSRGIYGAKRRTPVGCFAVVYPVHIG